MSSVSRIAKEPADETLRDVFRCFICMEKLCEAHLCPHCSKLCCYMCISKWLTEQRRQCPHCRKQLNVSDLVNCRWFEEVAVQVESLQQICSSIKTEDRDSARQQDLCRTHQEKLSVYCFTCKCCICHQCALWGGTHTGHTFKKLDLVYENHVARVKGEVAQLKQRLRELSKFVDEVDLNVMVVRDAKEDRANEMRNALDQMVSRLEAQLKVKLMTLMRHKRVLTKETEQLERIVQEIDYQIESSSHSQLINKSAELLKMLMQAEVNSRSHCIAPAKVPPDFASELVPQFDTCTFLIENFTRLQSEGLAIYSKSLFVCGLCWRLKVYPFGNGPARGEYLSVFLELSSGHLGSNKYEYRVQMLHKNPNKEISREFASDFEVGECWGYNRFFPLDLLASDGYLDGRQDTLELRFQVRPSTYFQRCRDQQWYIHELLKTNQQQTTEIADLKEQLEKEKKLNQMQQRRASSIGTQCLLSGSSGGLNKATKDQKSEVNESIFSEILKCLSSPGIPVRHNAVSATSSSSSSDKHNKTSNDSMNLTESSDEEGATGGGIDIKNCLAEDLQSLEILSLASGSSDADLRVDEEDMPMQRENLVEYSEMLVSATAARSMLDTAGKSDDMEKLLSLFEGTDTSMSTQSARVFSSPPFSHRLKSASVLETLQEPPRLSSSGPLIAYLSLGNEAGSSRPRSNEGSSNRMEPPNVDVLGTGLCSPNNGI